MYSQVPFLSPHTPVQLFSGRISAEEGIRMLKVIVGNGIYGSLLAFFQAKMGHKLAIESIDEK